MSTKENINVWIMPNAGFDTRKIFQRELGYFKKQFPDINVEFTIIPWSLAWYRLMDIVKGKETSNIPDVIQIGSTWTSTFAYLKGITEIDKELINIQDLSFIPQLEDSSTYGPVKSNIYSVPWFADIRVLYYRKDVFDSLGFSPEQLGSWESFMQVCKKIKSNKALNIYPLHLSGQKESILLHDIAPWIWSGGGKILSVDDQELKFINEEAIKGIEFYFSLIAKKCLMLRSEISPNYTGDFFSGMCAMQVSGVWPVKSFFYPKHPDYSKNVADNFGITLMPSGPGGRFSYVGGSHLAVTKLCKNRYAAHSLIKYLISSESQIRHSSNIGMCPSRLDIFENFFPEKDRDKREVFEESVKIGRTLPNTIAQGILEQQFTKFTGKLLDIIKKKEYSKQELIFQIGHLSEETRIILKALEEQEHEY